MRQRIAPLVALTADLALFACLIYVAVCYLNSMATKVVAIVFFGPMVAATLYLIGVAIFAPNRLMPTAYRVYAFITIPRRYRRIRSSCPPHSDIGDAVSE